MRACCMQVHARYSNLQGYSASVRPFHSQPTLLCTMSAGCLTIGTHGCRTQSRVMHHKSSQSCGFTQPHMRLVCATTSMPACHAAERLRHSSYMGSRLATPVGPHLSWRRQQSSISGSRGRLQVQASFFGVGAPEAVLVGLVALVIFGPQGLAEAAKTAGKAVRAFKPTLDELTSVSRDLRSTLDEELGINEIRNEFRGTNYTSPSRGAQQPSWDDLGTQVKSPQSAASDNSSSQDSRQTEAEDIDVMRTRSAEMAWGSGTDSVAERAGSGSSGKGDDGIANVSLDELQAELARRRAAKKDA